MKMFKVYVDGWNYDAYNAIVITADSKEQALELLSDEEFTWNDKTLHTCYVNWCNGELKVEEIKLEDIKTPTVICASFTGS